MKAELKVTITNGIGVERLMTLPGKRVICPRCEGVGHHANPAIGPGITEEEWKETDLDDVACYPSRGYNVPCSRCHGEKVVIVLDYEAMRDRPRWRAERLVTGKTRRRIRGRVYAQAEADAAYEAMERLFG